MVVHSCLMVGQKRFNAGEAVKAIRRFKVTHFPIVPPIMAALVHTTKPAAMPLECLVQVSTGAAPSSRRLIDDFVKAFPHVDLIQVSKSVVQRTRCPYGVFEEPWGADQHHGGARRGLAVQRAERRRQRTSERRQNKKRRMQR